MSHYGPQYHSYGATPEGGVEAGYGPPQTILGAQVKPMKKRFIPKFRSRASAATLCTCLFFPWILFTLAYADLNFVQYDYPALCYVIVVLCLLPCVAIGALASTRIQDMMEGSASSAWLLFLAVSSVVAVFTGALLGELNYTDNMYPYYQMQVLNKYADIDPSITKGQQLMDAGRVSFISNATIDINKAISFVNFNEYCVAPVTMRNATTGDLLDLKYYDFWVVGMNCCPSNHGTNPVAVDYQCGAYQNQSARDGLRVMSERQRSFYRLAAQQSQARYKINSRLPVFFYWVENGESQLSEYSDYGIKYFALGVFVYFVVQTTAIAIVSFVMTKHGV